MVSSSEYVSAKYVDEQLAKASWIIETGEEHVRYELWKLWDKQWRSKIHVDFFERGYIRQYGVLDEQSIELEAKCTFLKVNDYVVCMIRPTGRFADHSKMERVVKEACGISTISYEGRHSDATNAGNILYSILRENRGPRSDKKRKYSEPLPAFTEEQKRLFADTDYVVFVDGDFLQDGVEKSWGGCDAKPKISQISTEVIKYGTISPKTDTANTYPCSMYCSLIRINKLYVALFYNSGVYSDHVKLKESVVKSCPNATRYITGQDFMRMAKEGLRELMQPLCDIILKTPGMMDLLPDAKEIQESPPAIRSDQLPQIMASIHLAPPAIEQVPLEVVADEMKLLPNLRAIRQHQSPAEALVQHSPAAAADSLPRLVDEQQPAKIAKVEPEIAKKPAADDEDEESLYTCFFTGEIMREPVIDPEGNSYEKSKIEEWLNKNPTSPITRTPLRIDQLVPNRAFKVIIEKKYPQLFKS